MVRLLLDVGKAQGIRPNDIVGSIAYQANIPGNTIGATNCRANAAPWFAHFLLNPLVNRVSRRFCILKVKLWRSIWLVHTFAMTGDPCRGTLTVPMTTPGL